METKYNNYLTGPGPLSELGKDFPAFMNMNNDMVPCLHLDFWPNIVQPWFEKQRYWPKPEIMAEIHQKGCHLVWKSVDGEQASWRLSFSQAEVILARERSVFQKKCFLLAKLIFTVQTQHFADQEKGRRLSSYLIKTIMNLLIEETPQSIWEIWEEENNYLEVVENLFQRLSHFLKDGHMPCLFTEKMNLLRGFSQAYLDVLSEIFGNFFKTDDGLKVQLEYFKESDFCKIEAKFSIKGFLNYMRKAADAYEKHLPEVKEEIINFYRQIKRDGATKEAYTEHMSRLFEITGIDKLPLHFRIYRSIKCSLTWLGEWCSYLKSFII